MSIISGKEEIFGKIAALDALGGDDFKIKFKKRKSLDSANNKGDVVKFITDLITMLIGALALVEAIVNILTKSLSKIEKDIKKALKSQLQSIVSCGVNPSIPNFIKSTGTGIVVPLRKIDFFHLLRVNPETKVGKLLYNDVTSPLTNSKDFNTFLYGVIQADGQTFQWKNTSGTPLFDVKFNSIGIGGNPNNCLIIKANQSYDNKTLNDLNNNFIDTLTLFNTENIVNKIVDIIFGSISFSVSKSRKQLEEEEKLNTVIQKIIDEDANSKEGDSNSEGFYSFTNEEMTVIENRSNERQRGVIKIKTDETYNSSVPVATLTSFTENMTSATNPKEKRDALTNGLNEMSEKSANNIFNRPDKVSVKISFLSSIINNLIKGIVGIIISPKVIMIFLINYKIIYGPNFSYKDAVDFIKKNKNLIIQVIKRISGMIIRILLAIAIKKIQKKVTKATIEKNKERVKNRNIQIKSLYDKAKGAKDTIQGVVDTVQNSYDAAISSISTVINIILSYFKLPEPPLAPIPPQLILSGGALRPGISSKAIAAEIISRQTEVGKPTGDIFADGPNIEEAMEVIRIEALTKALLTDSVVNVAIPPGTRIIGYGIGNLGIPIVIQGFTVSTSTGKGILS